MPFKNKTKKFIKDYSGQRYQENRDYYLEYYKKRRKENIKNKICTSCRKRKAVKDRTRCRPCLTRASGWKRRRKEKNQRIEIKAQESLRQIDEKIRIGILKELEEKGKR